MVKLLPQKCFRSWILRPLNPRYAQPLNYDAPADVARDLGLTGQGLAKISRVGCNEGEMAVGGGFSFRGDPQDDYLSISGPNGQNEWESGAVFAEGGTIQSYVTCLTINVGLKGANQPAQPAQPPGGPALKPPLKLR